MNIYLKGMLAGQLFWGLCYAFASVGNFIAFAAYPILILGWLLVWGDNGPPTWAESRGIHIVFGLCFYGVIGAAIALLVKWRR